MKVELEFKPSKANNRYGKPIQNMFITTQSGITLQVKQAFYNSKLDYRLQCECNDIKDSKKKSKRR